MLLLVPLAAASGIMHPPVYALVDDDCAPLDTSSAWSADTRVRFAGHASGSTSPPGGPVSHHYWPVQSRQLTLRRDDCEAGVGEWVSVKRVCGKDPMWLWNGTLEPGASYVVDVDGQTAIAFDVAGSSRLSECPILVPPEPPPMYRSTALGGEERDIVFPSGAVEEAHGRVHLPSSAVRKALDVPELHGIQSYVGELTAAEDGTVAAHATIHRHRVVQDAEGEAGWSCQTTETTSVFLELEGTEVTFAFDGEVVVSDVAGRCL